MEDKKSNNRGEIHSQRIRAGKRTYFFDVKTTRSNDFYITITESKKKPKDDGFYYEKHKIFLYKEDFEKFTEALNEATEVVREHSSDDETISFNDFQLQTSDSDSDSDTDLKWD